MKLLTLLLCAAPALAPLTAHAQYLSAPSGVERQQEDSAAVTHGHDPKTDKEHRDEAEHETGPLKPTLVQPDAQERGENTDPEHDGHPGQTQGRE